MSPSVCYGQCVGIPTFQSEGWIAESCFGRLCNASAEKSPVTIPFLSRLIGKTVPSENQRFKNGACRQILSTSIQMRCLYSWADAKGLLQPVHSKMESEDRALSNNRTFLSPSNSSLSFSRSNIFDFNGDLFSDTRSD